MAVRGTNHYGLGFNVGTNPSDNANRGVLAFRYDARGGMGRIPGQYINTSTLWLNQTFHGGGLTRTAFYLITSGGIKRASRRL